MSDIEWQRLRNLTAREIIDALARVASPSTTSAARISAIAMPMGRRVTVACHRASDTFALGTLRSMIETQAKWAEADLCRLGLP